MIFVILAVCLLFGVLGWVVKKECFESEPKLVAQISSQKYTITEISRAVDVLLQSLQDTHSLLKVYSVSKSSPYLTFTCMLYNHQHPSVKNFTAKVKLPLSSKGKYVLESASASDSNEVIENGTRSIHDSQFYGNLKQ